MASDYKHGDIKWKAFSMTIFAKSFLPSAHALAHALARNSNFFLQNFFPIIRISGKGKGKSFSENYSSLHFAKSSLKASHHCPRYLVFCEHASHLYIGSPCQKYLPLPASREGHGRIHFLGFCGSKDSKHIQTLGEATREVFFLHLLFFGKQGIISFAKIGIHISPFMGYFSEQQTLFPIGKF